MEALTVETLAATLREPKKVLLTKVLRTLGTERTAAILAATLQQEAAGGLLTQDGTRRRTAGGVFLHLVKAQATRQERRRLFPRPTPQQAQARPKEPPQTLTWDEVSPILETLATHPAGEARTMKLTLIGRPGKVEMRGQAGLAAASCRYDRHF